MRKVPSSVTPTPYVRRRSLRYLLSQKRRVRASRTSSTAALRTSPGGSAQPPRWPWTKLWKTRVPSSSLSVRLCRFSVCSPEPCAREGAGHPPGSGQHNNTPPGGWKLQPVWPPFTHQGSELFHPFQDELLVAQRAHSQSLKTTRAELQQVFARQLPVFKAVILHGIIEAWRDSRGQHGGARGWHGLSGHFFTPIRPLSLPSVPNNNPET